MRPGYQVITIPLSGTVSENLAINHGDLLGLWVPTVTSGSMTIQAAYVTDAASANFLPVVNAPPNSGPFTLWYGPGSLAVALHVTLAPFATARFVTSVAQSAVRSLVAIYKV